MKIKFFYFIISCLAIISCKSPDARRPIQSNSGSFIQQSVERNKKIYTEEEKLFSTLMGKNSELKYIASQSGFWYFYNSKDSINNTLAKYGDTIVFSYNIKDLSNTIIVSEKEIGDQNYIVDKTNQDLISGLREGVKLMKEGETVTFLFPSYKAYGYYGLENIIGPNTPITSTVTLKTIK